MALYGFTDSDLVKRSYGLNDEADRLKSEIKNLNSKIRILAIEAKDLSAKQAAWEISAQRKAQELAAVENAERERRQQRRVQLLSENWKAMRSIEFERYLQRVFEELGFAVNSTKVVGDQGIDLIVALGEWRIAIQVKGYFNSVSIGAVQEAHTGMHSYRCNGCVVITNSRFTPAAIELASKVGCAMVDENLLPMLVLGHIDVRSVCETAMIDGHRPSTVP